MHSDTGSDTACHAKERAAKKKNKIHQIIGYEIQAGEKEWYTFKQVKEKTHADFLEEGQRLWI